MKQLLRYLSKSAQPIGIDIGLHGARMVQLRVDGDTPKVIAAARCNWDESTLEQIESGQTPSPALVGPQLRRMASQGQFVGREVVLAMPRDLVQVKSIRLPAMPTDELVIAAEHEARAMFGVSEENAIVRALPAGEVRQGADVKHEIIAIQARRAPIDQLIEQWHYAGFRPVGLDFDATALYRSVERFVRRKDDEAEVNVIAEIGHRRTLVLIGRGRELNFCKSFEIGGAMLTNAIARKLGITQSDAQTLRRRLAETYDQTRVIGNDPVRQAVIDSVRPLAEEIAREIALCLRYFSVNFRGQRPARVRVVGGESSDPTVLQLLKNAMPVPVEVSKPIANADLSSMKAADRTELMGEWSLAFGLALKFMAGPFADRQGLSRAASPRLIERATESGLPNVSAPTEGVTQAGQSVPEMEGAVDA